MPNLPERKFALVSNLHAIQRCSSRQSSPTIWVNSCLRWLQDAWLLVECRPSEQSKRRLHEPQVHFHTVLFVSQCALQAQGLEKTAEHTVR